MTMALQQYTCMAMHLTKLCTTIPHRTMKVNSYMGDTPFFELLAEKPVFHTTM